jgi:hypothetical protein
VPVLSRPLVACRNGRHVRNAPPRSSSFPPRSPAPIRARHRETSRPVHRGPSSASDKSPTSPALRANPSPEVTDRFCRLPLPTLFHRLEAVHLGDLLRIWVRSGARVRSLPRIFKGRRKRTGHHVKRGALRARHPYLRVNRFQGARPLMRKENSSQGSRRRLRVRLRYRSVPLRGQLRVQVWES